MIPLNPVERFNLELLMGHDVGDFAGRIWANALRAPRHSSETEPVSRLRPSDECRISQERGK